MAAAVSTVSQKACTETRGAGAICSVTASSAASSADVRWSFMLLAKVADLALYLRRGRWSPCFRRIMLLPQITLRPDDLQSPQGAKGIAVLHVDLSRQTSKRS